MAALEVMFRASAAVAGISADVVLQHAGIADRLAEWVGNALAHGLIHLG